MNYLKSDWLFVWNIYFRADFLFVYHLILILFIRAIVSFNQKKTKLKHEISFTFTFFSSCFKIDYLYCRNNFLDKIMKSLTENQFGSNTPIATQNSTANMVYFTPKIEDHSYARISPSTQTTSSTAGSFIMPFDATSSSYMNSFNSNDMNIKAPNSSFMSSCASRDYSVNSSLSYSGNSLNSLSASMAHDSIANQASSSKNSVDQNYNIQHLNPLFNNNTNNINICNNSNIKRAPIAIDCSVSYTKKIKRTKDTSNFIKHKVSYN